MMLDADIDVAVAFIDGRLDTMSGRSLVPTAEVVDLLLDLRALLFAPDLIGPPHV
jgi:hypothetical protein